MISVFFEGHYGVLKVIEYIFLMTNAEKTRKPNETGFLALI